MPFCYKTTKCLHTFSFSPICRLYDNIIFTILWGIKHFKSSTLNYGIIAKIQLWTFVLPAFEAFLPAHSELHSQPRKAAPLRAIVIQRLLFFPVFARCAQSALVTVQRGLGERDHTKPQIVLIQLPTPRLDNSPWREGPEKWIRPLALTFFPVHLPRDWRGHGPHSWALSPVPVLLAISYWPVFSKWTLIIYLLHGCLFDLMSPLNVFLEPAQTCDKIRSHQSWGRSPEIWRMLVFCIVPAEQTLHHNNYVEKGE